MRPLRLGILATEFFNEHLGGFGGFGFAARRVATLLRNSDVPIEPSFIVGRAYHDHGLTHLDGFRLLDPTGAISADLRLFRRARLDLILTVDWRPGFRYITRVSPFSDLIVWINAPVAVQQRFQMGSVEGSMPGCDTTSAWSVPERSNLGTVVRETRFLPRRLICASTTPALVERFNLAHDLGLTDPHRLGYGLAPLPAEARREAPNPTYLVLGRLALEKRPWIISEIARQLPDVEFRVGGGGDAELLGDSPPPNLVRLGHLDQNGKRRELEQAWGLVNVSVTEGMPIAFIEALLSGVPLVSTVNPEKIVSRFGIHVEDLAGPGRELIDPLTSAINRLSGMDSSDRHELGQGGRRWAEEHHSDYAFFRDMAQALATLGHRTHADRLLGVALERYITLRRGRT